MMRSVFNIAHINLYGLRIKKIIFFELIS